MSRPKETTKEQLEEKLLDEANAYAELILSEDGPALIKRLIVYHQTQVAEHQREIDYCQAYLKWLQATPREELEEFLRKRASQLGNAPDGLKLQEKDLEQIQSQSAYIRSALKGGRVPEAPPDFDPKHLSGFLERISTPRKPRPIKQEYIDAYSAKLLAEERGERITIRELAKRYTAYQYEKNPESATNAMQRGLKECERHFSRSQ